VPEELERLRQERDLYRKMLDVVARTELDPFLSDILALITEVSQARRGYLELTDERSGACMWKLHGCDVGEEPAFRAGLSHGVIAEALATRSTVLSISALDDERFRGRGSVRRHRIKAVLCAPILVGSHVGVIYLQDRVVPSPFGEDDRRRVEDLARYVAALAERLFLRQRLIPDQDPTQAYRRELRADGVIGAGEAMARVFRDTLMAARVDISVLLTGPTGTGKTMFARVLHASSSRAAGPFIAVNCAALPESLFERQLFGALPPAATPPVAGEVAAAERGTLLLDNIDELSPGLQARLLQLIQEREFRPLGGTHPVRADVRIVAATRVDLKAAVARHAFREDLYFFLNVMPIRLPSLAERVEDIPGLMREACERAARTLGLARLPVSHAAAAAAQTAEWPGNIRQLQRAVEAALLRACNEGASQVEVRHLFPEQAAATGEVHTYQAQTRRFQAQLVRRALDEHAWNVSETARKLDLTRPYLYKLMSSLGIARGHE
jgi:Nif-specific regulatory protein